MAQKVRANFSLEERVDQLLEEKKVEWDMTRSKIVNKAVLEYCDADKLTQIEGDIKEIKAMLERGAPAPSGENEDAHTHSGTSTECDGGVKTAPTTDAGAPTTQFESFDEYDADLPEGYELTREALKSALQAVRDGAAINNEHVDFTTMQSRGFPVVAKQAVVAGIIRDQYDEKVGETDIVETAERVLGNSRQAKDKLAGVLDYFEEDTIDYEKKNLETAAGRTFYLSQDAAVDAAKDEVEESQRLVRQDDLADDTTGNPHLSKNGLKRLRAAKTTALRYGVIESKVAYHDLHEELTEIHKGYLKNNTDFQ